MSRVPDRGSLTDVMIERLLATTTYPVGDAGAPVPEEDAARHAGWNGEVGMPGSIFVPYNVLTPATATISSGPFTDPQGEIQLPYQLSTFGVSRRQTEALANVARKALEGLRNERPVLDGVEHKIHQVWFSAIGGVGRVDATDPTSTYGEVDTLTVWLTK